jgi:hypothetical protein
MSIKEEIKNNKIQISLAVISVVGIGTFFVWFQKLYNSGWLNSVIAAALFFISLFAIWFLCKKSDRVNKYVINSLIGVSNVCLLLAIFLMPCFQKPQEKNKRERIAILLPLAGSSKTAQQDGMVQLLGVMNCITEKNYSDDFEFVFIDHKNEYDEELKGKINSELRKGTKYFFSTMSKVNVPLSHYFCDSIYLETYNDIRNNLMPILVCSATSTPDIQTCANKVYRYYVRSEDEGNGLCDYTKALHYSKVTSIFVDDAYGQGATNAFIKKWEKDVSQIPLKFDSLKYIKTQIEENISKIKVQNQAILICHYGMGMDNIIKSLEEYNVLEEYKPILLITSTFSNEDWQRPIRHILNRHNIKCFSVKPDYIDCDEKDKYNDDVKDFANFAFKKLLNSIIVVKKDKKGNFNTEWISDKNKVPQCLDINYKNGDIGFKMNGYEYEPQKEQEE